MKQILIILVVLSATITNAQHFTMYNSGEAPISLQTLAIDEDNRIWVAQSTATSGTIVNFHNGSWTLLDWEDKNLLSSRATDMIINEGIIEIASYGGVSRIDWQNQVFETWNANGSAIQCVEKDEARDLLYIGNNKLNAYDGSEWKQVQYDGGYYVRRPSAMVMNQESGILWVATLGYGVYKVEGNSITRYKEGFGFLSRDILDIDIDSNGDIWMLIEKEGLVHFDGLNWTIYNKDNSAILNNKADKIAIDNLDNIWLGGFDYGGLSYFDRTEFVHYEKENQEIPTSNIRQMKVDNKNDLWLATGSGLMQFSLDPSSTESTEIESISLFPNPAKSTINLSTDHQLTDYNIVGVDGKKVLDIRCSPSKLPSKTEETIDVSELNTGLYYIIDLERKQVVQKFLKVD